MEVIETLQNEHGLIITFLDNLTLAANRIENGQGPPVAFFAWAADFAHDFADTFHHFKEELVLFNYLAQKKDGQIDGQIEALRFEHDRGRDHISEIRNALEGYARGEEIQTTILLENLASYIHLLRHHIHKEDHEFYPLAAQAIPAAEMQAIAEEFGRQEDKSGGRAFAQGQDMISQMGALL